MPDSAAGTTPRGTGSEREAAQWVQQMFSNIAPRYDLLNHLLSFNIDRLWRRSLVRSLAPVLGRPDARILDLCCGTGDVFFDLQRLASGLVMGADFAHPMLVTAQKKARRLRARSTLFEGDAVSLPLARQSIDAITIAFGFRNLPNYATALTEFARVLKPAGILAILEFSHPPSWFVKTVYGIYSRTILPAVGGLLSGSREAYGYLPESIAKFPTASELQNMMSDSGFERVGFRLLTGGIAALHVGQRRLLL
jgi:demethylmenaquinone methyltransferase / 2-methoxy-6-polyprenyl-1,4-benzoquinol methylase